MRTVSLAPFEKAAACFDKSILAACDAIAATTYDFEDDPKRIVLQIDGMLRLLKCEARIAIGLLATSELTEHRAMADMCRVRMADAINLQRATSRCIKHCIKQAIVPLWPASDAGADASERERDNPWACHQVWFMPWVMAWGMAWPSGRG